MKNAKKKFGVIIYKRNRENGFYKIINRGLQKSRIISDSENRTLGHTVDNEKQGYVLYQITAKCFLTYADFDNFLYWVSGELGSSGVGMVIGHNDNDGFMWMDYPGENMQDYYDRISGNKK